MFIKHLQKLLIPILFFFLNCLFGSIKIANTTNCDTHKWQYSGYGIGFDSKGQFTHPDGGSRKNAIISGAGLSNPRHATALVFGHSLIQKMNDATIYTEKMYSPNFTVDNKIFV